MYIHSSYPLSSLSNPQAGRWSVGRKNSPLLWINSLHITKMKPNINSVKIRPRLRSNRRPVDAELVHDSLLWSLEGTFYRSWKFAGA
jgi:hypothetical protein